MDRNRRILEDRIWESFCMTEEQARKSRKKPIPPRFQNHPKEIGLSCSSSDSDSSMQEIHRNSNFTATKSSTNFEGIVELNNNDLLGELQQLEQFRAYKKALEKAEKAEEQEKEDERMQLVEAKQRKTSVVRVARILSSKNCDLDAKMNGFDLKDKPKNVPDKPVQKPKRVNSSKRVTDEKFTLVIEKILYAIDDIRVTLESSAVVPDGVEDMNRRKQRAKEFSGRFSRMYLYQLGRYLTDLQRITNPGSARGALDWQQKLLTAHQLTLQGLQAYQNHLPTSVPRGIPDKLKELLNCAINLCEVHRSLINHDINLMAKREDMINALENHCKILLEKVVQNAQSVVSLASQNSKNSMVGNRDGKMRQKRKIQSRLSMYSQSSIYKGEHFWKRTMAALGKKKFNVPSRYKTATLKHRPQPVKPGEAIKQKFKMNTDRSSSASKSSKSKNYNSDDIPTMVQIDHPEAKILDDERKAAVDIRKDILKPLTRNIFEQFCDENKDMTQSEFENLLQKLLVLVRSSDQGDVDKELRKVTAAITGPDPNLEQLREKQLETDRAFKPVELRTETDAEAHKLGRKKKQLVTVTGAKNAQLICIKDDNSVIYESQDEEAKTSPIPPPEPETKPKEDHNNPNLDSSVANVDCFKSRTATSVKISRLPKKALTPLNLLPKETALNVIQYKLDFSKTCKKNHMYTKTDKVQPWMLTGEIADKILEHVLFSVIREIEINELLENLYQSEFL